LLCRSRLLQWSCGAEKQACDGCGSIRWHYGIGRVRATYKLGLILAALVVFLLGKFWKGETPEENA